MSRSDWRGRSSSRRYVDDCDEPSYYRYGGRACDAPDNYYPPRAMTTATTTTASRRLSKASPRAALAVTVPRAPSRRHDDYARRVEHYRPERHEHDGRDRQDGHHERHGDDHLSHARDRRSSLAVFGVFGDERDRELRHVVTSALTAGAVEAYRLRKTPGTWTSSAKGGRVATAAIGAAVADTAVESRNPRGKHPRRHLVEATMAGLLTDRILNGKRT